jgi:hypothetical protein
VLESCIALTLTFIFYCRCRKFNYLSLLPISSFSSFEHTRFSARPTFLHSDTNLGNDTYNNSSNDKTSSSNSSSPLSMPQSTLGKSLAWSPPIQVEPGERTAGFALLRRLEEGRIGFEGIRNDAASETELEFLAAPSLGASRIDVVSVPLPRPSAILLTP